MQNFATKHRDIKRDDKRVLAAFTGWHDARLGLPMRPEYVDHKDRGIAAAYHNYRLLLIEARRLGIKLPGWNSARQMPKAIKDLKVFLADLSVADDRSTATILSGFNTTRRPEHLVKADLRNDMIAKGLESLTPQDVVTFY